MQVTLEAVRYLQNLKTLLPGPIYSSLFQRLLKRDTSALRSILAPYPQCWEEILRLCAQLATDKEGFGPSYQALEGRESPKGDGVLNTTLGHAKRALASRTNIKTVHERALFDCEDEQFEADMAIEHLGWAIDLLNRLAESGKKIGRKRDLDLLVARLSMALDWTKAQVIDLLRMEEAPEICSRLQEAKDAMVKNREKACTEWARAYREHAGHSPAPYEDVPVVAADSAFVTEVQDAHDKNYATHTHYSLLPTLLPADITLEVCTENNVNADVNAMVNGRLASPSPPRAWSYFLGNVLGLTASVPLAVEGKPLSRSDDWPRAAGGATRVFYAPEELYVLLRLYVKLHDRVSSAMSTCTALGKLCQYDSFLAAASQRGPYEKFHGEEEGEEWGSVIGHGVYNIRELLGRISKHILGLREDSRAVQAIQLHEMEAARWRGGEIDDGGYYANAKFALFPFEAVYQFEVMERAPGKLSINVRLFPDEFSRTSDLNTIRCLVGYYTAPAWAERQLLDVEKDQRLEASKVLLWRNLELGSGMADLSVILYNGCLHRVTEKGHALVRETEDVFVRHEGPVFGGFSAKKRSCESLEGDLDHAVKKLKCCES